MYVIHVDYRIVVGLPLCHSSLAPPLHLQSYKCNSSYVDGRLYHLPFGDSSASLNGTLQSGKSQQSYVPFVLRYGKPTGTLELNVCFSPWDCL